MSRGRPQSQDAPDEDLPGFLSASSDGCTGRHDAHHKPSDLLSRLRYLDARFALQDDRLVCTISPGVLDAELKGELRQYKKELVGFLESTEILGKVPRFLDVEKHDTLARG